MITAFKAAGLEAESIRPLTKDDYGLAPYVCTGVRFLIPSLGANNGGRVFACDDPSERDRLAKFYADVAKSSAIFFSWVFARDNILVQINGDLKEDQARKYEAALNAMK